MRTRFAALAGAAMVMLAAPVAGNTNDGPKKDERARSARGEAGAPDPADPMVACAKIDGLDRNACLNNAKRAAASARSAAKGGLNKSDAALVNNTNAAAKALLDANDFAGAAAQYQKGIDASPNNPARHVLYAGLAMALRRQGIAAYNSAPHMAPPPAGASNALIRAFNAEVARSQAVRTAASVPILRRALDAADTAATVADASPIKAADVAIGVELREIASLLFLLDPQGVLTTLRPGAELEATWLRRWLTATVPLAESLAAKFGMPVAATLVAKDKVAGLALGEEVRGRIGTDLDGAIGYAEVVVAAKTPLGDAHRVSALAGLNAVEATVADFQKKKRIGELKAALTAP